jgi:hypothetical protein
MADLLQVTDSASQQKERPGPFKEIEAEGKAAAPKKGPLTKKLDPATINLYLAVGDGWFKNNYKIVPETIYLHYSMYARERYESFKDLADGKWVEGPQWYNDGVRLLQQSQKDDGTWAGQDTPEVATCFAVLFLLRSTQGVISKIHDLGSGVQLGGYSFPDDVANIQESGGKVLSGDLSGDIDQVLALLQKGDDPNLLRMIEESKTIKLDGDVAKRQSQIESLRLFVSASDPTVRLYAVRGLGRVRGLEHVPKLLFALSDKDGRVVREADLALRFVSRKTAGVGLPDEFTIEDAKAAQAAWKTWYLSVKPDAELLD